jgi:hypothetical protein
MDDRCSMCTTPLTLRNTSLIMSYCYCDKCCKKLYDLQNYKIGSYALKKDKDDVDYIKITGPYGHHCFITVGDFESILSGICGSLKFK